MSGTRRERRSWPSPVKSKATRIESGEPKNELNGYGLPRRGCSYLDTVLRAEQRRRVRKETERCWLWICGFNGRGAYANARDLVGEVLAASIGPVEILGNKRDNVNSVIVKSCTMGAECPDASDSPTRR